MIDVYDSIAGVRVCWHMDGVAYEARRPIFLLSAPANTRASIYSCHLDNEIEEA